MIESILEKSIAGQRLEPSEAVELFATKDILLLGNVASRLTRKELKNIIERTWEDRSLLENNDTKEAIRALFTKTYLLSFRLNNKSKMF